MFTRAEAIEFAFEQGLKGANFIYHREGECTCWYWEGDTTDFRLSGRFDVSFGEQLNGVLHGRGDGWFVSAKVSKGWVWFFDYGDEVPHG